MPAKGSFRCAYEPMTAPHLWLSLSIIGCLLLLHAKHEILMIGTVTHGEHLREHNSNTVFQRDGYCIFILFSNSTKHKDYASGTRRMQVDKVDQEEGTRYNISS